MTRTAANVRREFIEFFTEKHGHKFVPSSPVVPHDDPTLLFTNAGMNQFKPYFLGTENPSHPRAANTQKCIRAGGKHNDLDDVGHDTYHHTFFEMLGNWSFGDYFKAEAIAWAWELLVDKWGLDPERLHATYFEGDPAEGLEPDEEAKQLWLKILPPERVHPGNKKDNFWEMGDTGPCGPCSEIHVDLSENNDCAHLVNADDGRVIEIWNLVFIQFNRDAEGKLSPLPAKHVDTGMGFERVTSVLQGHNNNYGTDVFVPIIQAIEKMTGHRYGGNDGADDTVPFGGRYARIDENNMRDEACRVIADHVRCLTFALTDGAIPDREGRGYVLRRILRRGVRFGWQYLDLHKPFICDLVDTVVDTMGDAFPELRKDPQRVKDIIREEEESFGRTLERGIALFEQASANAVGRCLAEHVYKTDFVLATRDGPLWNIFLVNPEDPIPLMAPITKERWQGFLRPEQRQSVAATVSGEDAFKLHDTYGFPIDLTQVMAEEKGLKVDIGEFERLMEEARIRSGTGGKGIQVGGAAIPPELLTSFGVTDSSPKYDADKMTAKLCGIVQLADNGPVLLKDAGESINVGDNAGLIFESTCFYAEAGGQVGDIGAAGDGSVRFDIEDTQQIGDVVVHFGTQVMGNLTVGDEVEIEVNTKRRATMQNHTATHMLNWALREVLGDHVQQKGSLVDPEKTRFDFSHPRALTAEEISRIEQLINERIEGDLTVHTREVPQGDALKINGLRAVFGERYPDMVRVMSIGVPIDDLLANPDNDDWPKYSIEFCGGTHLTSTKPIEQFVLSTEEAVAKGVRRVVGLTGMSAQVAAGIGDGLVKQTEALKQGPPAAIPEALVELQQNMATATMPARSRMRLNELIGELQQIVRKQQKADAADALGVVNERVDVLLASAEKVGDTTVVVGEMPDVPVEQLKSGADRVKQKCGSAAVLFGTRSGEKAVLLAAMTPDLIKKGLKAGDLVKNVAKFVKGGGGGPPTMAQAGGKDPEKLPEALDAGRAWIGEKL